MIWPASCIIYWTLTPPTSDFNFPLLCNDYNACIHCCGIVNINNLYFTLTAFFQNKYRLTHGFRRYTGNIPEVLMSTARGRSPRAVLISTEGISLYTL